jgi:dsDNA-specific endonuclease/ATPase MutS2
MRDIRSDLEERANVIEEQVRGIYAHFERAAQQLQRECDAKVAELKETRAMIDRLMQFESGIMDKVVTLENPSPSQPSLADRIRAANAG